MLFSIKVKEELKDRKENVEGTGKRENTLCEPIWPIQVDPDRFMPDGERYNSIR